ncbi:MAG: hypothetical protein GWO02_11655, partial [Gammaproteobacteria bacterium]|nr:hypothetical protein [Gammaproteobacteria bacterium]
VFLALVGLFPPDSRGETYVAATVLILLLSALAWGRGPLVRGLARLSFVIVGLWPFVVFSAVPGAAVRPLAGFTLATAVGLGAAALPQARRQAPR